jgi:O-methyltransferase
VVDIVKDAGRLAKKALRSFGYELRRAPVGGHQGIPGISLDKYHTAVNELHGSLCELLFPDLPQCPGRRELLARLIGTSVGEAMYIVAHLHRSMPLDGDVCEFGVAQGATSALLANEILSSSKHLWLFDSFEGLPKPSEKDVLINDIFGLGSIDKYAGTMASPIEMVQNRLRDVGFPSDRTRIRPGFIDDTLKTGELPNKVCFAYIDFDFYEPILATLRWLRTRIPSGGVVIVDDYGFFSAGAKSAVDEFVAETSGAVQMLMPRAFAAESTPFCILQWGKSP